MDTFNWIFYFNLSPILDFIGGIAKCSSSDNWLSSYDYGNALLSGRK